MAKITYYLGAGASYHACPILNNLSQMMIDLAEFELQEKTSIGSTISPYKFIDEEKAKLPDDNKTQILWHIGYFGKKALKFNTIDTYARKLSLSGSPTDLNLLKMSVSVFFDLWENFYEERYNKFYLNSKNETPYTNIDYRYTSLFSILLNRPGAKLEMNDSFKFITWNYDLQLEATFKSFMRDNEAANYNDLNEFHFTFKENEDQNINNDVFHLNGHRGFFIDSPNNNQKTYELKHTKPYENYWDNIDWLFKSTSRNRASFHQYIKYAWEQNLKNEWFSKIENVLKETEILIIVGYSFPPFNREIDQHLFSKLDNNKLEKIVYQDPNANKQIIENLFEFPQKFTNKIILEPENLDQFYIPNEHFISRQEQSDIR